METLNAYSTEQLKALYNTRMANARREAEEALKVREVIEERHPNYRGRSMALLKSAVSSLFGARTFANTPHDLPADENPYRTV